MSIFDGQTPSYDVTRPNQRHGAGDPLADVTEQFTGTVEGTIKRRSIMAGFVPVRSVRGTSTISNRGISKAKLQKIAPGTTPPPSTEPHTSKIFLKIDTVIIARNAEPMLDEFQTDFDYQGEVAREQGQEIANMYDETFFIMAAKAAIASDSPYGTAAQMPGHSGGNVVTLAGANDYKDPAKLYAAIASLVEKFLEKDVRPNEEDMILVLPPAAFTALMQAEHITNGEYVTSAGETLNTKYMFAAFGVPVITSNNAVFGKTITDHLLSNANNEKAYDGDFKDIVAQMFSPKALLAGSTIPVTSKIFFDDLSKLWFIDSWLAFGVTINRTEYAGVIKLPAA
ncbi:major head protein [Cronobacter phage vB_CskP_GAP227]|uniref:Major capsid protein n=1 Tax=Cronobacter phage vB_CskP_GAP227 TaxID=1264737 RepID=K9RYI7_9CAUD|nr:major head protein [Cronobacter phage vB_CskP_GAP227]AFY63153.1 major capsid protein [Cronobacter phage vB_CskP_GAP227]